MNQYALLHVPDSRYCFATGPKEVVIRLRTSKMDKCEVKIIYESKYVIQTSRKEAVMLPVCEDALFRFYEIHLRLTDSRLAYVFKIIEGGKEFYYSEDGLTETYNFDEAFYNFFQLPYININDVQKTVDWMRSAVFYQIFVDRFNIGNKDKDTSYINMEWGGKPTPKSYAGGDIKGIIDKLDYIEGLGVNAIYLTPVFSSVSNHKYDIYDYMHVDPMFGNEDDLKKLVSEAHKRGIRIVLDAVFNHCSMNMAQFKDVVEKGKESEYYNWFIIDGDKPDPEKMNYECFAACNYMPKLNTAEPSVQNYLTDVAEYWIKTADIDGWRLDVSDEVSHEFWRIFRKKIKSVKPDCVIIGENWHDAYPYLQGDQYDSIMNYAFTKACLDYFARGNFSAAQMAEKCNSNLMRNKEQVNFMMLNLLDSHDTLRFFTEVNKNKKKLLAAIALMVMYPGAPCIYYGTEICMEGGYDPDSRRCFDWDDSHWDKEVMSDIKNLLRLKSLKPLQYGRVIIESVNGLLHLVRKYDNDTVSLYINMSEESTNISADYNEILAGLINKGEIASEGFAVLKGEKV